MDEQCTQAANCLEVSRDVAVLLRQNPIEGLKSLKDCFTINPLPYCYHHHERCLTCSGQGKCKCSSVGLSNRAPSVKFFLAKQISARTAAWSWRELAAAER